MEEICVYCANALQPDDVKCQLQCRHSFHTNCLLRHFSRYDANCPTCHAEIFAFADDDNESVDSEFTSDERNLIRFNAIYDTNEGFRKDAKKYMETYRATSKSYTSFTRVLKAKKNELLPQYTQIKGQVKQLFQTKKNEIMNTTEYKAYKSAQAKNTRFFRYLQKEYDLPRRWLNILRTKPGYRSVRRPFSWRHSPTSTINRALRLRLPYY